jgi:hypothetical protein
MLQRCGFQSGQNARIAKACCVVATIHGFTGERRHTVIRLPCRRNLRFGVLPAQFESGGIEGTSRPTSRSASESGRRPVELPFGSNYARTCIATRQGRGSVLREAGRAPANDARLRSGSATGSCSGRRRSGRPGCGRRGHSARPLCATWRRWDARGVLGCCGGGSRWGGTAGFGIFSASQSDK